MYIWYVLVHICMNVNEVHSMDIKSKKTQIAKKVNYELLVIPVLQ